MKYKDILKNKELLEKEVPAEILKMLGFGKKGFEEEEKYYYIDDCGRIDYDFWDNDIYDIYRLKQNNAFHTEKECEFEKEKQEVLAELQEFSENNNTKEIDWNNSEQEKWFIRFNWSDKELFTSHTYIFQNINNICFTSEELAKQAVAKVGEDRIKKYLFGVEV